MGTCIKVGFQRLNVCGKTVLLKWQGINIQGAGQGLKLQSQFSTCIQVG